MEGYLVSCIQESVSLYLYDNARFLCERLVASFPSEYNKYLLATCYKYCNQVYRAYHLLQGPGFTSANSRYLLAQCCLQLGKLPEAETALKGRGESEVPNGGAGFYLLGKICRLCGKYPDAARYFVKALTLNPNLWSAYEELCQIGEDGLADEFCNSMQAMAQASPNSSPTSSGAMQAQAQVPNGLENLETEMTPCAFSIDPQIQPLGVRVPDHNVIAQTQPLPTQHAAVGMLMQPCFTTPSSSGFVTPAAAGPPAAPPAVQKREVPFPGFPSSANSQATKTPSAAHQRHKVLDSEGKVRKVTAPSRASNDLSTPGIRRSARLAAGKDGTPGSMRSPRPVPPHHAPLHHHQPYNNSCAAPMSTDAGCAVRMHPQALHPRGLGLASTSAASMESQERGGQGTGRGGREGTAMLMSILLPLYQGYRHLSMYRCQEAVQAFGCLTPAQQSTAWVYCQLGRAYFEVVDYPQAARMFECARRADPQRVEGMEVYSTVLWHMKREMELSHLAQEISGLDRLSPQAWCVMGNCMSLQKEHEVALQFFQRALQLDPSFTYAYTLCGHEFFANEDFEKGLSCYRSALEKDKRHYNALYGIGQIYYRQEKYELARKQFESALAISGRSSVLACYLGMTLHREQRHEHALSWLHEAISSDPKNPLARYERATVLTTLDRPQEALEELEVLKEIAPREASVYFQMGRLYKSLGQLDQAMQHFNAALGLKPPASDVSLIKTAIEKIDSPDGDDEEDL